ncbi:MAG: hypothetical protein IKA71_08385 [Lentisphaeria bacterium]|nr:hypothetical protein [Lentisphaeria bacterium]
MSEFWYHALNYAVYPLIAFALSLFFTAVCIRILPKLGFIDAPGGRHIHARIVPRGGGIAIVLSVLVTMVAYAAAGRNELAVTLLKSGTLPGALIVMTGIIDDRIGLKSYVKLIAQIIAAVLIWYGLDRELTVFGWVLPWYISLAVTVLWVVGVINAFNMIDGLDGLAAGLATISGICLSVWFISRQSQMALFMLIFVGACAGFLRYNFSPAKIFLGDTGSMFLGLFLAVSGAGTLDYTVTATTLLLPPLMIGVPIFDMMLAVWRRSIRKKINPEAAGLMDADSDHLHHRLLRRTQSHSRAAMIMYVLSAVFALLAIILLFARDRCSAVAFVVLTLTLLVMLRNFAVVELYDSVTFLRKSLLYFRKSLLCSAVHPLVDLVMITFSATIFCFSLLHRFSLNFILLAVLPVLLVLAVGSSYRIYWLRAAVRDRLRLFFITLLGTGVSVALICWIYLKRNAEPDITKFVMGALLFMLMTALLLSFERFLLHYMEGFWLSHFMLDNSGDKKERVLLAGRGVMLRLGGLYFNNSQRTSRNSQVVGIVGEVSGMPREFDTPVLGKIEDLPEIYRSVPFDRVLIIDAGLTAEEREKISCFCRERCLSCADFVVSGPGFDRKNEQSIRSFECPRFALEITDMVFFAVVSAICSFFMFSEFDPWCIAAMFAMPVIFLAASKLYRVNWGLVGLYDRWRLLQFSLLGTIFAQILCVVIMVISKEREFDMDFAVGALIYILVCCGGLQLFRLLLHPGIFAWYNSFRSRGEKILILGGGLHCRLYLFRLMIEPGKNKPVPIGIIDDDPVLHGMLCHGLRVLGGVGDLVDIRKRFAFDRIVVTPAVVSGKVLNELYRFCADNDVKCSTFCVCERNVDENH